MHRVLAELVMGRTLTQPEAEQAFDSILRGEANEVQVGAMLALIARRGPTIDELIGGARAMRAHATRVPTEGLDEIGVLLDTCGTGGAPKTFNISTAVAFVAAAARGRTRVLVAKHGGRSRSGRGSAEVLEALGVNIAAPPQTQRRCLEEVGVCFCFAIHHHPAMKFAAGPRKSLGFPTIFNLLGPLTNPAGAPRQLMGVYDAAYVEPVARALKALGSERAMVVHGSDGLDEITTTGLTLTAIADGSGIRMQTFDAAALGMRRTHLAELQHVDTIEAAAALIQSVLAGEQGPARDIVLVNAAAALTVAGAAGNMPEGLSLAADAIASGRAKEALEGLARASRE